MQDSASCVRQIGLLHTEIMGEPAKKQIRLWRTIWTYGVVPRDAREVLSALGTLLWSVLVLNKVKIASILRGLAEMWMYRKLGIHQ